MKHRAGIAVAATFAAIVVGACGSSTKAVTQQAAPLPVRTLTEAVKTVTKTVRAVTQHLKTVTKSAAQTPTARADTGSGSANTSGGPASNFTTSQQNAVASAKNYLSLQGFSRHGLIAQLSSSAGEGYSVRDATVAV